MAMAEGHGKTDTEMTVCRIKERQVKLGSDGTGCRIVRTFTVGNREGLVIRVRAGGCE